MNTRERILGAAVEEFARYGLGGARVDRIARRAAANKRMLYYYFGDKDGLFLAALEDRYEHIRGAERTLELEHLGPREALERLVRFTWEYFVEHPEFMTLLNSENLHKGRHVRRSKRVQDMHSPLVETLARSAAQGRGAGPLPQGGGPGAALHLDRRRDLLLPEQPLYAVAHLRPRPHGAARARRRAPGTSRR